MLKNRPQTRMVKPTISGNRAQKITTKKTLKKIAKHPLTTQSRFNSTTEPPDQPATQSDAKQRFLQMIDPDRPIKAPTTPQSTTGPFRGASRELDDDIPLEQSNVNANIVTRRLVAQFPHPIFPTPTEQERSSPLYRRFKGERETWATNPNCKANVRPSWTNYKSYETWKRLKEYCTKGQSRELADFLSKPQNKNVNTAWAAMIIFVLFQTSPPAKLFSNFFIHPGPLIYILPIYV